jgi:hypothetical protein
MFAWREKMSKLDEKIIRALDLANTPLEELLRDVERLAFALETGRPLNAPEKEDTANCLRRFQRCLELLSGTARPVCRGRRRWPEQPLLFKDFG